jgi:hypothetical protein
MSYKTFIKNILTDMRFHWKDPGGTTLAARQVEEPGRPIGNQEIMINKLNEYLKQLAQAKRTLDEMTDFVYKGMNEEKQMEFLKWSVNTRLTYERNDKKAKEYLQDQIDDPFFDESHN